MVKHDPSFAKTYVKEKEEMLTVLKDGDEQLYFKALYAVKNAKNLVQNIF